MAMGSGSDTSVDNSNASGASDKTGTESDNVVMVGGSFEKDEGREAGWKSGKRNRHVA